jgi:hypothetical protein
VQAIEAVLTPGDGVRTDTFVAGRPERSPVPSAMRETAPSGRDHRTSLI